MNLTIRQEQVEDYEITEKVVECAFANAEHSEKKEHNLVSRVRKSNAFIPKLSLVAIDKENNEILGHIILSKIKITNESQTAESLALAPVSVLPEYQNKGVGRLLILEALKEAKDLGYNSVVVLSEPSSEAILERAIPIFRTPRSSFEVPDEAFMAIRLHENALNKVSGVVEYPSVFFE